MLKIYVDAATRGNPGPSAGGVVILGDERHEQIHFPLGVCSNHEAEFRIFIQALELLVKRQLTKETVLIYSDSKIVVQTFEKKHAKNPLFKPYLTNFCQLELAFSLLIVQWIPENKNKGADTLARQALQKYYKEK